MARTNVPLLLALLLASCTSFDFSEQVIELRRAPERDALEARILYLGVDSGEARLETAIEAVQSLAAGGPPVIVFGWPYEFAPGIDYSEDDKASSAERQAWEWIIGYEVLAAGALVDEVGRLGLWQEVRWPDLKTGLEVMNTLVRASYAEGVRKEAGVKGDPHSRRVVADQKFNYIAFDDRGALCLSFTATPRDLADFAKVLTALGRKLGMEALDALEAIEVQDDIVTLVFAPGTDGWIRTSIHWTEAVYEEEFLGTLRASQQPTDEPLFSEPPTWVRSLID